MRSVSPIHDLLIANPIPAAGRMYVPVPFRRAAVIVSLASLSACVDATSPTEITRGEIEAVTERSSNAQDRLEAVFQRIAPDILALPGTVFADNDERAGRLVFGVENRSAANGVLT